MNMKALDKVFDTQVITGIIGDKFHSIEAKRKFLYEEGKTDKKDVSKLHRYRRKSNRIYQSQRKWNIERCIKLQII